MSDLASPAAPGHRAVIIGGGLAAMLTAHVLSKVTDVLVIERDTLPTVPKARTGLPQARHTHVLWSGGADAIEALLPGTAKELDSAGARRIPLTTGMVALSPQGWYRRWPESHYAITCSRDLLDWVIRQRVLREAGTRITVMERTSVVGLTGSSSTVTGVATRREDTGEEDTLLADLVIDASGRASRTPQWLAALGVQASAVREVDSGLVYASRIYQAPDGLPEDWPIINVQANPRGNGPGQGGVITPLEGGRWLVTLHGTHGGQPTKEADEFQHFARKLRHPIIGELISKATPVSPVSVTHMTANRRHFYEKAALPDNLLTIGDSVASYNPTYGHGMSVIAQGAVILRNTIQRHGWNSPGLARHAQKAIAKPVNTAWTFATGTDVFYPGATGTGPTASERLAAAFVDRLSYTATGSGPTARALTDVMTLRKGPERLAWPDVLIRALVGPVKPPLDQPPLTAKERAAVDYN
ncbi:flavin-dependent dehydrogenase [Streptomyces sp. Ag109_O5-1]|uniref:FAD-dependent monooxygenase n=1 Tax=Streptomyces sp. Ag109_O5-1 TaxID=1938851 RepID=UPI000F4F0FAD|nr:FAD-dependent monooxygenase [Streptomyces sp. Ag109_O5-1]RPE39027.1 flavin-dependent dehydrogenase [Streptomyces sp. Ag109_O5-1]